MRATKFRHLGDRDLLRRLAVALSEERTKTATVVALIAEVDSRKLYLQEGYPSMFAFCVHLLHLSHDAAYKRIQAARSARQFPEIFSALAKGRLHLTAVNLLAPHLTPENAAALIRAATHKTKPEIELLLVRRFPRTELMPMVHALPTSAPRGDRQLAPAQVEQDATKFDTIQLAPAQVEATAPRAKMSPLSAESYALQVTISRSTHEKLEYARALLSHRNPCGDLAQVLDEALDALVAKLERQRFAATRRPRSERRRATAKRTIPAHVKRAVWQRDQGQCTFTSESGHRCESRTFLEFDHVDPAARGGEATVRNLRLRCSTHNQLEAERVFGAGFMAEKRQAAQRVAQETTQSDRDLIACLRSLKFRADEVRGAVAHCHDMAGASLEDRVRRALHYLKPRARCIQPMAQGAAAAP